MAKKTYKSKKSTSTIKTINIFLLILVVSASIATASYFLMKKENSSEIKKENNILQAKIENKKIESKPVEIKPNNTKPLQTKTPPLEEPKNNQFDEYPNDDDNENDKEISDTNKENKQEIIKKEEKKEEIKALEENKEPSSEIKKESVQDIIRRNIEELEKEKQKELEKAKLLKSNQDSSVSEGLTKKEEPLEIKKEENNNKTPEKQENNNEILEKNKEVINNSKVGDKPKLAIVIDDVTTSNQKNRIKNIDYKITMAFLPPTKGHPNSAKIALDLPFYMIHFPMQASKAFKGEEANTLHTSDSYEKIDARVKQLREWYPNAVYTNNHTGSIFTAHDDGMDKLFQALKKYNFIFVDSRTASKSVAKKYAQKYGMPHISRTTFLDNNVNYASIEKQLKDAVKTAKRTGKALAIGHPHNATLKVLENSKNLLKDVELVYVNEL